MWTHSIACSMSVLTGFDYLYYLTHSSLEILPKNAFWGWSSGFWTLSCCKELKLTTKPLRGRTLRGLLIQMHNFSFRSSVMRRKQKFRVLGFKRHNSLDFYFSLSLLPSFFAFLASFLFSLAGNLVGFIFEEKVFRKAFRWVVEQDFHGNFMVFWLFLTCPWPNCAHYGVVWKISSLCLSWRTKLSSTIKSNDITGGRNDVDPHWRLLAAQKRMG